MPATPTEVFHRLVTGITAKSWTDLAPLYAEDAQVSMPFGLPEPVVLRGREEIAQHFAGSAAVPLRFAIQNVVIHQTTDPDVIIAEFDYDGQVTTTGHTFRFSNVQVLRVRDGLIAETRDYHDHARIGAALARQEPGRNPASGARQEPGPQEPVGSNSER